MINERTKSYNCNFPAELWSLIHGEKGLTGKTINNIIIDRLAASYASESKKEETPNAEQN